jgi:high-affinity Fe2+/Pb2+ permease
MNGNDSSGMTRSERIKKALMMFFALVLFVLGVWLLIEPTQARGSEFRSNMQHPSLRNTALVDNVDANSSFALGRVEGAHRK